MKRLLVVTALGAMAFLNPTWAQDEKVADKLKDIQKELQSIKSDDEAKKVIPQAKSKVEKLLPDLKDEDLKEAYSMLIQFCGFLEQKEDALKYCNELLKLKLSDDEKFGLSQNKIYLLEELGKKDEASKLIDKLSDEFKGDKNKIAGIKIMKANKMIESDKIDDAKKMLKEASEAMDDARGKQYVEEQLKSLELIGTIPKDFKETAIDGGEFSLAKYKGKWVLIDFWATWCGPCRGELPNVKDVYAKYKDKGFAILGISLDKDEGKLKDFLKEQKMEWPQYFDGKGWDSKLAKLFEVHGIPYTMLVDPQGKIYRIGLRGEPLKNVLAKNLNKK